MRQRGLARRRFLQGGLGLAGLGVLSGCGLLPPPARTRTGPARIGVLTTVGIGSTPAGRALLDGLKAAGWVQGENLRIDYRFAFAPETVATAVSELLDMQPDVLLADSNSLAKALESATTSIPIVMAFCNDPVRTGLITSLARPGGNVTGLASLSAELTEKRLDLLKQALPHAVRLSCLSIPQISGDAIDEAAVHAAGRKLGLQTRVLAVGTAQDIREAFAAAVRDRDDAIVMLTDSLDPGWEWHWTALVASTRMPVMSGNVGLARAGTLMAYGPKIPDLFGRAAVYVDKILRGAKPADLPVEQPTEFDFVVNEKVARASGLTIPGAIVQQATEIVR